MANLPPLPPAGRAPQGGPQARQGAMGDRVNPKLARAGAWQAGPAKQGGVSKVTQSNRRPGGR